jgi:hypothetical protein
MRKIYAQLLHWLPIKNLRHDDALYILTDEERTQIMRQQYWAMALAAAFSMCGFLLLYEPQYWLPDWFGKTHIRLPFTAIEFDFALRTQIYGLCLMLIEIAALTFLNLYSVHFIAAASGFLTHKNNAEKGQRVSAILDVSLEVKNKELAKYGIDPFQGMSAWLLFVFNLLLRLKGMAGSLVLKWIIGRWFGRFAVRRVMDMAGMPIYMFLNAYSIYTVLREARVVIMGQQLIERVLQRIDNEAVKCEDFELLLYDTLQFIAVNKRDYHQNHFILTRLLLKRFGIAPKSHYLLRKDYLERLRQTPEATQRFFLILIHLGFLLDGELSWNEEREIRKMRKKGIKIGSIATIKSYLRSFMRGEGMENLFKAYGF